ncbi:ribonucleotide reductase-associated flavodoxin, putative [Virgibacillus subterraneus]|uniref:Ribonucleotide reductase-associated flavodoxin, putative n=2 Tax=Virgibacillus TaxID=84406 RepID=A0A1H0Y690_9BACI|nr:MULTISPECIES: flavodoxin [Virgibacillus]SDQ10659.1 ribonucleotide reductase-associated flavodoxin, putative [Virgibacillus salinus]SEP68678.1 ribonucleotide reductase-associated flavodoxin, putative [Virgibacillus subterraneus]
MRSLVAYLSYSGNTKEVAEIITDQLQTDNVTVDMHRIGIDYPIDASEYDQIFLGTFTWDMGRTPDEVKDFVQEVGYKPEHVAVFGTGDTQFGGDTLFCRAVDKLSAFYHSQWPGLKIEQSPRGSQEHVVEKWVEGVLHDVKILA